MISDIISTAEDHVFENARNSTPITDSAQHRYEKTFADLLSQLKNANQTAASQDFADPISNGMLSYLEMPGSNPDSTPFYAALAHAAGLDDAFGEAFTMVCSADVSCFVRFDCYQYLESWHILIIVQYIRLHVARHMCVCVAHELQTTAGVIAVLIVLYCILQGLSARTQEFMINGPAFS